MERKPTTSEDLAIQGMNSYQRSVAFGRAYNELDTMIRTPRRRGEEPDINQIEGRLIGQILRFRRLGYTPTNDYKIQLSQSQDLSSLHVDVTRKYHSGIRIDLAVEREGRDPGLQALLDGTIKSHRNSGKPRTPGPIPQQNS